MPLLYKKRVLAAKAETTIGTPESLTASEGAFNAYNVVAQASIPVETREAQGSMGQLSAVPGIRTGTISFRTDVAYNGTDVPGWATVLFPLCGVVNASGTFTPRSEAPGSNVKTGTIGVFEDGLLKSIAGAVGTFTIVYPAGRMAYIDWVFTGVWQAPTDTALIEPTYPTVAPLRAASITTTWNSVSMCWEQLTLTMNNEVQPRECSTAAAGVSSFLIIDRKPVVSGNPESVLVATQDRFGAWLLGTENALSVAIGSAMTLSAPKAQIVNIQEGNRKGVQIDEIEWQCNKNGSTADQDISIVFN